MKYSAFLVSAVLVPSLLFPLHSQAQDGLLTRTQGYVLLQVEQHGEAWYVNPADGFRYYMKDGATAYEMMRAFGLGITNADLVAVQGGNQSMIDRLRGRILLQVEARGEAYYVHPRTGEVIYMPDGNAAYEIMRFHSLGITDADLAQLSSKEFIALASVLGETDPPSEEPAVQEQAEMVQEEVLVEEPVTGDVLSEIDHVSLNTFWRGLVNKDRIAEGNQALTFDETLFAEATVEADMYGNAAAVDPAFNQEAVFTRTTSGTWDAVLTVTHATTFPIESTPAENEARLETYLREIFASYPDRYSINIANDSRWQATAVGLFFITHDDGTYTITVTEQVAR